MKAFTKADWQPFVAIQRFLDDAFAKIAGNPDWGIGLQRIDSPYVHPQTGQLTEGFIVYCQSNIISEIWTPWGAYHCFSLMTLASYTWRKAEGILADLGLFQQEENLYTLRESLGGLRLREQSDLLQRDECLRAWSAMRFEYLHHSRHDTYVVDDPVNKEWHEQKVQIQQFR